jgi:hypothetical protein
MPDVYNLEFSDQALTTYTLIRQAWLAINRYAEAKLGKVGMTPETFMVLWICRDYPITRRAGFHGLCPWVNENSPEGRQA